MVEDEYKDSTITDEKPSLGTEKIIANSASGNEDDYDNDDYRATEHHHHSGLHRNDIDDIMMNNRFSLPASSGSGNITTENQYSSSPKDSQEDILPPKEPLEMLAKAGE